MNFIDQVEHPIPVEGDERSRKRKRNDGNTKRALLKKERYNYPSIWFCFDFKCHFLRYKAKSLPSRPSCAHSSSIYECKNLSNFDIMNFAKGFYQAKDKPSQDAYILTYCEVSTPKRNDRHAQNGPRKGISINYRIRTRSGKLVKVCQKAFCGFLNIGRDRVPRVCKRHLDSGGPPIERRGGDRKSKKFLVKQNSVISFIKKFRTVEVHYCRGRTKRQYLPSELSINKMYLMYCDQIKEDELQVKASYFRYVFNTKFNIGFKSPATDICSKCQMFKETIKVEKDPKKKQELMVRSTVHKRRAKAFYKLLKEEKPNMITICFDCQKNMSLPKLSDQAAYFSRQLSLYNCGVVLGSSKAKLTKENVFLYVWGEYDQPKGSNEIASIIFHRLCKLNLDNIECVRLVADGCGGQNKNSILMGMCSHWLATKAPINIKSVEIIFPVVGHSFLPPDRVFAQIEKTVKTKESLVSPAEYNEIYDQFGTIVQVGSDECPVYDFKTEVGAYFKPPGNWHFHFNPTKRFTLTRLENEILVRGETSYVVNNGTAANVAKRGRMVSDMQSQRMKTGISIKSAKIVDVDNLLSKHFGNGWREMGRLKFLKSKIGERTKLKADPVSECEDDLNEKACCHDHDSCEHDEDDTCV